MNIVLIGPQGSGKGTQARLLIEKFNLAYFSPGEVLRDLIKKGGPLANKINETINIKGELIPDDLMMEVMNNFLVGKNLSEGIIFDGFPRSLTQAKMFNDWLKKEKIKTDMVIYLDISRKTTVNRLSSRWECPQCEAVFNLVTKPPKKEGDCDLCQAKLVRRTDDQPEAIKRRLEIFHKKTRPVIDYYKKQGILEEIDGERPIQVIFADILKRLS